MRSGNLLRRFVAPFDRRLGPRVCATASFLLALAVSQLAEQADARADDRLFQSSGTFALGSYPEGFYPHASRVADLDGDGFEDVVASNHWYPNNISVVFHDGETGYLSPDFLIIGSSSMGVEVADFTGDGRPDILAANTGANYEGSTVSLLQNLGGKAFATHLTFSAVSGPTEIVAADFDGDTDIDAAVAGYGSHGLGTQVAILENDGSGGFLAPTHLSVGVGPSDLRAGDLNGDGYPDLVIARDLFKLTVVLNNGDGSFAAPVHYSAQEAQWAGDFYANVEVGDVDQDMDLDVFYSSTRTQVDADYGRVALFRNQGNGTLTNRSYIVLPRYLGGAVDMVAADVTGDSRLDLLTVHTGNGGWVATPATGSGTFGSGVEYAGGNDPMKVAVSDVDADGDLDALVVNRYSLTLGVHLNLGEGTFLEPQGRDLEPLCGSMDAGDIDGDGDLDVASAFAYAGGGGLSVIQNAGNGTFQPRQNYAGPRGAMSPRLADLDGDQDLDLVWAFDPTSPPYDYAVRLNTGAGAFGAATIWPVGTCGTGDLITMDVDSDGDQDVLLTDYLGCTSYESPWVWIRRNNGDATFSNPYVIVYDTSPKEMAAADFDGDGREDLATIHANGLRIVRALGNGQFAPYEPFPMTDTPHGLIAADLSGDGAPDVATANIRGAWEGTVSVYMNDGSGDLGSPFTFRSAFSTSVSPIGQLVAEDADLDGDRDLMLMSYGGQDILVYENDGNGGFALQRRYVIGAAPSDFRCLDFTGDGRMDLGAVIGLPPSNLNRRFVVAAGIQRDPSDVQASGIDSGPQSLTASGANPFRDFTELTFSTSARTNVRLTVHDVSGREVAVLLDGILGTGEHAVSWDGRGSSGHRLPAGVYLARLSTSAGTSGTRLVLM